MNASDIVKAKQNQVLYQTLYRPSVYASTVFSTIRPISSIINYVSSGVPIGSTSYASCIYTVPTYTCAPRFMTYELARAAKDGAYECGDRAVGQSDWVKSTSSFTYAYNISYSTMSTGSSIRVTSTLTAVAPSPFICLGGDVRQGTAFSAQCASCSGGCCPACSG
jgi:hypothetical protein